MSNLIKIFAPATVANVACGFDVLGFAVMAPGDTVTLEKTRELGVSVVSIEGDGGKLPKDPTKNVAAAVVKNLLDAAHADFGVKLSLKKEMPLSSGMGSSAASSVAALYAANCLLDKPLTKQELLPFAMEGERIACGSAHADNVAPALFGGFVLIRSYSPLDVIKLPTPDSLYCALVHPQLKLNTSDSRGIIKSEIPLKSAIKQWGNVAGLVAGLYRSDFELIGRSLTDYIFEPERSFLIPCFDAVKAAALKAGALGCSISGSGPSLFALSSSEEIANRCAQSMKNVFNENNIAAEIYVSKINSEGPLVIEKN